KATSAEAGAPSGDFLMTRVSKLLTGALLAACLVQPVAAQSPQSPTGGAAPPVPPPAPTHLACARELVMSTGLARSFLALIPEMMRQINATVTQTRPELIPDMKATLDKLQPEFNQYIGGMVEFAANVYTQLVTEPDCKTAVAFFTSASGKKYVEVQPSVY